MKLMVMLEGTNLLEKAKEEIIKEVIKHCETQGEASEILGLNVKTLRKYLKEYKLELNPIKEKRVNKLSIVQKIANYILKGENSEMKNEVQGDTAFLENERLMKSKHQIIKDNMQLCATIAEKIRNNETLTNKEENFARLLYENKLMKSNGEMTEIGRNCLYQ